MTLEDVGMLVASSNRTRLYIQQMVRHKLAPSCVLVLPDPEEKLSRKATAIEPRRAAASAKGSSRFDLTSSIPDLLYRHGIPFIELESPNPNAPSVVKAVRALSQGVVVYSGPGGVILRDDLLETGKHFLHVHPGILPEYRGSTTVYYSLLHENRCGATALFLDRKIDTGPVIATREFVPPEDRTEIDFFYDPFMRSELLVEVLGNYRESGEFNVQKQTSSEGETYYVIHPVLKHIAILGGGETH